jgi:hypothetical protein
VLLANLPPPPFNLVQAFPLIFFLQFPFFMLLRNVWFASADYTKKEVPLQRFHKYMGIFSKIRQCLNDLIERKKEAFIVLVFSIVDYVIMMISALET